MARPLAERFEGQVDRSGYHHLWTGAVNPDRGTGRLKVAGRNTTAHRVAWELEHGDVPSGARVLPCPDEPRCVSIDHLRLEGGDGDVRSRRSARGGGSKRQVRPGVWELSVSAGRGSQGEAKRVFRNINGSAQDATRALAALGAEVGDGRNVPDRSQRGVTVSELVDSAPA